jgi:hypothetical protein
LEEEEVEVGGGGGAGWRRCWLEEVLVRALVLSDAFVDHLLGARRHG